MSRSMISRSVAVILAVVVVVAFTFVTGETAHAAAKKKSDPLALESEILVD